MTPWLDPLRSALAAEFAHRPRVATLATVDAEGRPRARSVVIREVEDDGSALVAFDLRSPKTDQTRLHPSGEIVFWLAVRREQFRLAGGLSIADGSDPRVARVWSRMTDTARALFSWPDPGRPRDPSDTFPDRVPSSEPIPASFGVLILAPDRVERLVLTSHPHDRVVWALSSGWNPEAINP